MKHIVWQLLNLQNATRSEVFAGSPSVVRSQISDAVPEEHRESFAVLVLADVSDGVTEFSRCPVLPVSQFINLEVLKNG